MHPKVAMLSAAADPLDLALLVEVAELYCLVCPPGGVPSEHHEPWHVLQMAIEVSPYPVLAGFAATCSEALLGIAEYLVEDVLLVASGAAAGPKASAAGPRSRAGTSATSGPRGTRRSSDTQRVQDSSSRSRSSSGKLHPTSGGTNRHVTLAHHVAWAQLTITTLGLLMVRQEWACAKGPDDGSILEQKGEAPAV
jgi:hypothetical protein